VLTRQRLGTPDRPDAAAGNREIRGGGLEPGHPRRRLGRTLALSTLLQVVLVEAIGIDAPPLVWIWLIIHVAIDLAVFASIVVTATRQQAREAGRSEAFR
jgi:hypothetical protein